MSTHIKILTSKDIKIFDWPPEFNGEERKHFFSLPTWVTTKLLETFRTPTTKVGFILQLGYFKAVNKFFSPSRFYQRDIHFIARKIDISLDVINLSQYTGTTLKRHKDIILEKLGVRKFDESAKDLLLKEALSLCSKQMKPRLIFMSLVDFLREKKVEIPNYNTFAEIISDALRDFEKSLITTIEKRLSIEEKQLLDELLKFDEKYLEEEKQDAKIKRYKITLLKKTNQSTRPSRIKENIRDLQYIQPLFQKIEPVIEGLNLSSELIQYYAQVVIKSRGFQMSRQENKRYLLLMAFIAYQYYWLNDILIEVLMQSVQTVLNTSQREHKENFYNERKGKHQSLNNLAKKMDNHLTVLKQVKEIVHDQNLSSDEKVNILQSLFIKDAEQNYTELQREFNQLGKESSRISKNVDFYDLLEKKSIKLQKRASEIVKNLQLDQNTSNKHLIQAIDYYKQKDGNLGNNLPTDFLEADEQEILFDSKGKFRISLYKVLLFLKIANGIRAGALNLKYSYRYRAFDDYLISKKFWESGKKELLEKAGLSEMEDFSRLETNLKQAVQDQFRITNENIRKGVNQYATISNEGSLKVQTPKQEKEISETAVELFPKNRFISLFEVLSTVNKICQLTDCFEHWQIKHNRNKPTNRTFFAGIIGYGCNLGIRKIAKISRNINQYELENTTNWYFIYENILHANDKILELLDQLQLPNLFRRDQKTTHTSSDGQKFSIGVESLNANYSYKYFGKGRGISIYSFIDEGNRLFYSIVINPLEREAAYVIDGLMHNDVIQSDVHSTDTHGYSEMIFGVTHLLGISFAPRIKRFKDQRLYSFESPSTLKALGYQVLPSKIIKTKLIQEHWDDILRLIATIKLKEATASQLFKRLTSYSKQHPLYRALKQFGRIIKTLFLLKYIDDIDLRQAIEKQLNKIESSNKFGKAVFYGNNQEFQQSTKEEQLITEGCKRLIENAIICWNYLYLSKLLHDAGSDRERKNLINTIKNGSVVVWQHINLQGEYDFSEETLKDSIEFKLPELLEVKIT